MKIEEKILQKILFQSNGFEEAEFSNIDFEKLTRITSKNLMLPSLYINLSRKNLIKFIPKDFYKYLKYVYNINKKRNIELIKESNEIAALFSRFKIKYCFIKGTSNLLNNIYFDVGERMVGDLDFLIDEENSKSVMKLLRENKYENSDGYHYKNFRHLNRLIKENSLFAIEPHINITNKNYNELKSSDILKNSKAVKKNYVSDIKSSILINMLNHQINDNGQILLTYNYRNLYDHYLLSNLFNHKIHINSKLINNYSLVLQQLDIDKYMRSPFADFKKSKATLLRIKIKRNNKFLNFIDFLLHKSFLEIKNKFSNLIIFLEQIIINNEYRRYFFKKYLKT